MSVTADGPLGEEQLGSKAETASHGASRPAGPRCPACGQPLPAPPPARCPLCDFTLRETQPTHLDVTPYAVAYEKGKPAWRRMIGWVWNARTQRMNHIALMRSSSASAHFAQVNTLLLAAGLAVVQTSIRGWHDAGTGPVEPKGAGWFQIVGDLWWNPAQAIVAAGAAFATVWLLITLVRLLIRRYAARLHKPPHHTEQRMTAAIDYSTAFAVPIVIGCAVLTLRVLTVIGSAGRWTAVPPLALLRLLAGIVAGLGVVLWWFWLLRLGAAAPQRSRRIVMIFLGAVSPVLVAGVALGWWFFLDALFPPLFERMGISF